MTTFTYLKGCKLIEDVTEVSVNHCCRVNVHADDCKLLTFQVNIHDYGDTTTLMVVKYDVKTDMWLHVAKLEAIMAYHQCYFDLLKHAERIVSDYVDEWNKKGSNNGNSR